MGGVNKTSKVMVIGSSLSDVLQVSTVPPKSDLKKKEEDESKEAKESTESQKTKQHKKVLEKGKPEDAMPGVRGRQEPLPSHLRDAQQAGCQGEADVQARRGAGVDRYEGLDPETAPQLYPSGGERTDRGPSRIPHSGPPAGLD